MSLEKQLQENTEALRQLTAALLSRPVSATLEEVTPPLPVADTSQIETPAPAAQETKAKEPPKEDLKDLKAAVKKTGAELLAKKGKEALKELLSAFGVTKLSALEPGANVYEDFINRANALLEDTPAEEPAAEEPAAEDDDPLAEDAPIKELTFDEVKAVFLSIQQNKKLGTPKIKEIFAKLGVGKLYELKTQEQYDEAMGLAEITLKAAGE